MFVDLALDIGALKHLFLGDMAEYIGEISSHRICVILTITTCLCTDHIPAYSYSCFACKKALHSFCTHFDVSRGHPVLLHLLKGGCSAVDNKWLQLSCPHKLYGLLHV